MVGPEVDAAGKRAALAVTHPSCMPMRARMQNQEIYALLEQRSVSVAEMAEIIWMVTVALIRSTWRASLLPKRARET